MTRALLWRVWKQTGRDWARRFLAGRLHSGVAVLWLVGSFGQVPCRGMACSYMVTLSNGAEVLGRQQPCDKALLSHGGFGVCCAVWE